MTMKIMTLQTAIPVVIAVLTTIATNAFTSYLLARPWCIQIESDVHQRILYGSDKCASDDLNSHQRFTAQKKRFDYGVYSEYQ